MKNSKVRMFITITIVILSYAACGDSKKQIISDKQESKTIEGKTTILPYMNERQKQVRELFFSGKISKARYDELLDADNTIYKDLLISTDLSNYSTFTDAYNSDGSTSLIEVTDKLKKKELKEIIQIAITENRIKWQAALSGDSYGTYITILPKAENGEIKGTNRGMTIFIAGLFEKSVLNAFDSVNHNKDSIK